MLPLGGVWWCCCCWVVVGLVWGEVRLVMLCYVDEKEWSRKEESGRVSLALLAFRWLFVRFDTNDTKDTRGSSDLATSQIPKFIHSFTQPTIEFIPIALSLDLGVTRPLTLTFPPSSFVLHPLSLLPSSWASSRTQIHPHQ